MILINKDTRVQLAGIDTSHLGQHDNLLVRRVITYVDQIPTYNQNEGRRTAVMARQENERRKEENRMALDG